MFPDPLYVRLPNWIGDVCMILPCIDALLATGLPLVVAGRPWARELLSGYPLAGFIEMRGGWWRDRGAVRRWRFQAEHDGASHTTARRVRGQRPAGLLLPDSLSSALTFRLAGLACAGWRDDGRSLLLRWPLAKPRDPSLHAVQRWWRLTRQALAAWGCALPAEQPPARLGLRLTRQQEQAASSWLHDHGLVQGQFVLVAPTATGLHQGQVKVWPGYDGLVRAVQGLGYEVVMCPPPGEVRAARALAPTARCLPSVPLGVFTAVARRAGVVVCNDSGVSHLAAAVGARQVTLFGVTDPSRTGPWSTRATCLGALGAWPALDEVVSAVGDFMVEAGGGAACARG